MTKDESNRFTLLIIGYHTSQCFMNLNYTIMNLLANGVGLAMFLYFTYRIYLYHIENRKMSSPLVMIPLVIILENIYMTYFSVFTQEILAQNVKLLTLLTFVYYMHLYKPGKEIFEKVAIYVNCSIFLSILLCFALHRRFAYGTFYGGKEYFGFIVNPHSPGLCLVTLTVYNLFLYMNYKRKISIVFIIANILLLFLLNVRTYQLAIIISIAIIILLSKSLSIRNKIIVAVAFIAAILVVQVYSASLGSQRTLATDKNNGNIDGLSSGRSVFWQVILTHDFDRPAYQIIIGEGIGSTLVVMKRLMNWSIGAHNDFIQMFTEFGAAGIVLYITMYIAFVRKIANKDSYSYVAPLLITQVLAGFINGSLYYTFSMLIFLQALYNIRKLCQETREQPSVELVTAKYSRQ